MDCAAVKAADASAASGVYTINPDFGINCGRACAKDVYCDMATDGGGWTVNLCLPLNDIG